MACDGGLVAVWGRVAPGSLLAHSAWTLQAGFIPRRPGSSSIHCFATGDPISWDAKDWEWDSLTMQARPTIEGRLPSAGPGTAVAASPGFRPPPDGPAPAALNLGREAPLRGCAASSHLPVALLLAPGGMSSDSSTIAHSAPGALPAFIEQLEGLPSAPPGGSEDSGSMPEHPPAAAGGAGAASGSGGGKAGKKKAACAAARPLVCQADGCSKQLSELTFYHQVRP